MSAVPRASLTTALILLAFTVAGTALLAYTFSATKDTIAKSQEREKLALIGQTLPREIYDNDLLADTISLPPTPLLGSEQPSTAYRARKGGQPAAVVLEVTAPDGYSGKIRMLVAIRFDGTVTGVRVVAHSETPGLGDYIDIAKSKWIRVFEGKSLTDPPERAWKVKKDDGSFDYMAGATITPRAVVKAVARALRFYAEQQNNLFQLR
jgi:electron transport complex protein RnfG